MAKPKKPPVASPKTTFGPYKGKSHPVIAFVFIVVGVLMLISLVAFDIETSQFKTTDAIPSEKSDFAVGVLGELVAFGSLMVLGISSWVVVFFCFWSGYMALFKKSHLVKWPQIVSIFSYILAFAVLGAIIHESNYFEHLDNTIRNEWSYVNGLGGFCGELIYSRGLRVWLGPLGTSIIVGAVLIMSLGFLFAGDISKFSSKFLAWFSGYRVIRKENKARKLAEQDKIKADEEEAKLLAAGDEKTIKAKKAKERAPGNRFKLGGKEDDDKNVLEPIILEDIESEPIIPTRVDAPPPIRTKKSASKTKISLKGGTKAAFEDESNSMGALKINTPSKTKKAKLKTPERKGDYIFPSMGLLAEIPVKDTALDNSAHKATAAALIQTLANFNVKVTMKEVFPGPVITRYEVLPAPGVKVGKILALENDIALGLKAMAVRIQAPVPGKGTVGIEVPNLEADSVFLRDIIESEDWVNSKAEIPVALGKEVSGRPLIADLTKMPHLLIAGATGAGKTVCINTIIASLLYHSSPEDVRFIMVDPKIVEMQVYNDLPHMMIPVVTDPKKVPGALKWLLKEMEKRYQIFAKLGVRNISGFNDYKKKEKKEKAEATAQAALDKMNPEEDILHEMNAQPDAEAPEIKVPRDEEFEIPEKIPYIVCIIDELADLMMVAQAEIETGIARLAQLARAAGIHLIIATQRPSVNVITGIIKANLPSRIAFQVSSKVDSRTILDAGGAEQLIGRGDMLFSPPGSAALVRSQGCFVSDDEINGIVAYLKEKNGGPRHNEEFKMSVETSADENAGGGKGGDDEEDELLPQAYEVLRTTKRASTSMLQRRLKIGYNRAARIMELLEDRGIVGPENGSRPREFLVDPESL